MESTRVTACRMCVFSNNNFNASNTVGSNFKFHSGNTNNSQATWIGQYTEYVEISDNLLGPVGAAGMEIAPQNGGDDERLRFIVLERNVITNPTSSTGTRQGYASAQNLTFRDNACYMPLTGGNYPQTCDQFGNRGSLEASNFPAKLEEAYNNTCYGPNSQPNQNCLENDSVGGFTPAVNSFFQNNMLYVPTGTHTTIVDTGGNTVSNNTASPNNNPGFTNGSGGFTLISDWKPTANYSGGTTVPVFYDALGVAWSPNWDLGAVHH